MQTINLPAGSIITITTGHTEAKAHVPETVAIPVRKAVGLNPLYLVRYTSQAGNTDTYGVFWEGPAREDASIKRLGLKPMLASGHRMVKQNRYSKMSKGFFVNADKCQPVR